MKHHRLRMTVTGDEMSYVTWGIECPDEGDPDRPCGTYVERREEGCRCTDAGCPCREDEHDACTTYDEGYINDVGPRCQCEPTNQCWYAHALNEVGPEMFTIVGELSASWDVDLSGSGWEETIDVSEVEA